MGNIFSNAEKSLQEVHDVQVTEEVLNEIEEISEIMVKDVIEVVVEEIAVTEIESKLKTPHLEKNQENKPYHPSPTHYSNLKRNVDLVIIKEYKSLTQYEQSELTTYKELKLGSSYFSFYS